MTISEKKTGREGQRGRGREEGKGRALYSNKHGTLRHISCIYILPSTWITEPLSLEGGSDLPISKERVMIDLNQWS